jgi:hypothetical protein
MAVGRSRLKLGLLALPALLINVCFVLALLLLAPCASSAQTSTQTPDIPTTPDNNHVAATLNWTPADSGAVWITWNTGDNSEGEVFVSADGEAEKLFAKGTAGYSEASWLKPGSAYEFRLYSGTEPRILLATLKVTGTGKTNSAVKVAPLTLVAVHAVRPATVLPMLFLFIAAVFAFKKGRDQTGHYLLLASAILATLFALSSVLSVEPRPFAEQPFPDAQETADATRQLISGNGYVTYVHNNERHPPRYPPGFSIALSPFAFFNKNYPSNIETGAKVFAALYVLTAVIAAWSIGGALAAALVAVFINVSPFARAEASLIMSDALAAGITVLFIVLLQRLSPARVAWLGALAGALVVIRLPMIVNLAALLIVLPAMYRKRFVLFATPFVAALGFYNWSTFGSPLRTGYSYWMPTLKSFALHYATARPAVNGEGPWIVADALHGGLMQWACPCPIGGAQSALPNVLFYPSILLGLFWTYSPPLITLIGLFYIWKHRREATAEFTLWLTLFSLALFTFYFYQGTRFMAAPATLLVIFTSVSIAEWVNQRIKPDSAA